MSEWFVAVFIVGILCSGSFVGGIMLERMSWLRAAWRGKSWQWDGKRYRVTEEAPDEKADS